MSGWQWTKSGEPVGGLLINTRLRLEQRAQLGCLKPPSTRGHCGNATGIHQILQRIAVEQNQVGRHSRRDGAEALCEPEELCSIGGGRAQNLERSQSRSVQVLQLAVGPVEREPLVNARIARVRAQANLDAARVQNRN